MVLFFVILILFTLIFLFGIVENVFYLCLFMVLFLPNFFTLFLFVDKESIFSKYSFFFEQNVPHLIKFYGWDHVFIYCLSLSIAFMSKLSFYANFEVIISSLVKFYTFFRSFSKVRFKFFLFFPIFYKKFLTNFFVKADSLISWKGVVSVHLTKMYK